MPKPNAKTDKKMNARARRELIKNSNKILYRHAVFGEPVSIPEPNELLLKHFRLYVYHCCLQVIENSYFNVKIYRIPEEVAPPYNLIYIDASLPLDEGFRETILKKAADIGLKNYYIHIYSFLSQSSTHREEQSDKELKHPANQQNETTLDQADENDLLFDAIFAGKEIEKSYFDLIETETSSSPHGTHTDYLIREKFYAIQEQKAKSDNT